MKNFAFGFLIALSISIFAETPHEDGSITYSKDENLAIYGTLKEMSEEIARLINEVNKANRVFSNMSNKIKELESRKCV